MRLVLFAAGTLAVLAALAAPVLLPRADEPPPLRASDSYLIHEERALFNGTVDDVIAHLRSETGTVLAFVERTDRIAGIGEEIPLVDTFPNEGAVRILRLTDGSQVTERVLEYSRDRFAYQIWAFTAPAARPIDHIHGSFTYADLGDGTTEVTWTYAIAPRVFWARPFIRGFLSNDFAPFMRSGLTGSATAFNATGSG